MTRYVAEQREGSYHRLSVHVPCPQVLLLMPNPQGEGVSRRDLRGVIRSWGWIQYEWDYCPSKRDVKKFLAPFAM